MNALGKHAIIELYDCDRDISNDQNLIKKFMLEAVEISGATVVNTVFHQFSPHGITGIVVVAESHFAIHTWPEYGYCAIDIFTCGDIIESKMAIEHLKNKLCAKSISIMEMNRGIIDLGKELRHKPIGS